jgi:alpha-methylacyl-CoA racemase
MDADPADPTRPQAPLAGLRVVELAGLGPAPFAAMLLAELGADVVRVQRPGGASELADGGLGRSRPNVAVDLKHPDGPEVVLRLVEPADVLIEGLRPGVTERLGLGPAQCLARNPRLVYGRMTGWGQTGPLAQRAGHDITYAAITGALHLVGGAERPRQPVNVLADFGGGALYLLVGVLAALHARQRTGRGQVVDAAMVDGAASLITMIYGLFHAGSWRDEREANLLDGGAPFYDTYQCADGGFVAVGALEPQFYAQLLAGLGLSFEADQNDRAAWPRHRAAIAARLRQRTRDEWAEAFAGTDACLAPVLSLAEAPHHPHLAARGTFAILDGELVPRVAPRFSDTPALDPGPARAIGADTREYLLGHGFTAAEVEALLAAGAVRQA